MKFAVVDIETTGLAPEINEIIEIGAVLLEEKGRKLKIIKKFDRLIKPYNEIPPIITSITGIDDSMVQKAPRFQEVASEFLDFIGDAVFVAHNVLFDLRMINIALQRYSFPIINNPSLDTQDMIAVAYPTMSSHRLTDVIDELDIKVTESHRALADAEATAEVLQKTLVKIRALPMEIILQMYKLLAQENHPFKEILADIQKSKIRLLKGSEISELSGWKKKILVKEKFKKSKYTTEENPKIIKDSLIDEYFAEDGMVREVFPKYEYRPQQAIMSKIVTTAFNLEQHALIEAGTGTGKSAAYLLPALLWIKQNGGPIVVSTRTKNLQSQLMDMDIPTIKKLFPKDKFQVFVLKGRQNYICLRRFELLLQQMVLTRNRDILHILPIFSWLLETTDGDLSELHSSIEKKFSRRLNSEHHSCLGEKCSNFKKCLLQHVRRQAKQADLLIANHSLVFVDLHNESGILPEYSRIIIDEAHSLEDAVTETFSESLGYAAFMEDLKTVDQHFPDQENLKIAEEIRLDLRELFMLFAGLLSRGKLWDEQKVQLADVRTKKTLWPEVELIQHRIQTSFKQYFSRLDKELNKEDEEFSLEARSARFSLEAKWLILQNILAGRSNYAAWLRFTDGKPPYDVFLEAAPIDIGEIVQENLFSLKKSVVLTSATLTVNNNFDYYKERLGISKNREQKFMFASVGSPFNYKQKMLFAMPDDIAAISLEKQSIVMISEYLVNIFEIMSGRTLVLFTSYRMMEDVFRIVRSLSQDLGISVLCQGKHGSRKALLNKFKHSRKTVLLGTNSFWEGIDVAGEALSCVVIVKLPFAVPTEPIYQERSRMLEGKGLNPFYNYSVPQAVIRFKQGIGRLIRTQTDKGIVMVLDERIFSKNYGRYFLQSLPGCEIVKAPRREILEKIKNWM